jgi:hypothetical protein
VRRKAPTGASAGARQQSRALLLTLEAFNPSKEIPMPVILWLLGVPLGIVVLLMLFGVL